MIRFPVERSRRADLTELSRPILQMNCGNLLQSKK